MAKKIAETPLMKQYIEMKRKHPDAVLLFRVGDFYETFSDDAVTASEILGITLTRRANGSASHVELAGFPHHALDTYLPKLVRAGKRVAICEQLEDPKLAKKLVKRGITELVTPGVALGDNILDHRENNFLAAVSLPARPEGVWGVAFLDISTGEFYTAQGPAAQAEKWLASYAPKEVLVERGRRRELEEALGGRYLTFELDDWVFTTQAATDRLLRQFETASLKGFGVHDMGAAVIASGAILHYLDITCHTHTSHITTLSRIEEERYVRLDAFTVRNLELLGSLSGEGRSLLSVIDRTATPMGARMLRRWLLQPLCDPAAINARLDVVEHFLRDPEAREAIADALARVGDLERLASKVAIGRVNPRELLQLAAALRALEPVREMCTGPGAPDALLQIGRGLDTCPGACSVIERTLCADAPAKMDKGKPVIAPGVSDELDELRALSGDSQGFMQAMLRREQEATGITSLKIGSNNVFGYYLEVTNTHKQKVPPTWERKQTLVNAERYITPELKAYEERILNAQTRIAELEARLYAGCLEAVRPAVGAMRGTARDTARLDVLLGFTLAAIENRYCRPLVDDSLTIDLRQARHPVIEKELPPGTPYIANDITLDNDSTQVMMITGPNMSGKSALLRQTALNVIMAQTGCFVAADSARIGVVDKVFTRVGASDNLALGESTFMVEMLEAASILNNLSRRSLVLFDELGRGTSTYDGISIAWAIVEHIHQGPGTLRPKTLFATHYHELNEMAQRYPRVKNYNVAVKEIKGKVVFLRKLEPGGSDRSFGIHVAKLAGMPAPIVKRAGEVLRTLEQGAQAPGGAAAAVPPTHHIDPLAGAGEGVQLSFFQLDDPVLEQVRDVILGLDINNLTPVQALNRLNDIKQIITGK